MLNDVGSTLGIMLDAESANPLTSGGVLLEQNNGEGPGEEFGSLLRRDEHESSRAGITFKVSLDKDSRLSGSSSSEAPSNHRRIIEDWLLKSKVVSQRI